MIYSEAERKEIERVYGVFKDYIHASKFLDFVWSEKLGYLLLHIDPTKNTIEEDQIITSADELCAELFNEVATDVFKKLRENTFILMQMMTRLRRFADVGSRISTCFLRIGVHAERFTPQNKRKEAFSMICPLYSFQCFISLFAI